MKPALAWMAALALAAASQPALRAEDPDTGKVTVLPPFLVEEQEAKDWMNHPIWSYAKSGGLEILSACSYDETLLFVQGVREQQAVLSQFIPDEFLLRTTLPYDDHPAPKVAQADDRRRAFARTRKAPGCGSRGRAVPADG